ncbi:class I SAM-dependent methyltransferase [Methanothrix harundinacea]|jgi:ubiquinone/menaquinone biosynthesis C-methylase UbiE|uniref:Methyltransferase type 11 n=1 Tax=Methanothrix harundinacea (strain 6Ac) TaxID=1110509 RepID=G7WPB5_METH6|nr:class I SAM-dependent methyltransferase [Methanothrix harundinacea]AET64956.1 Methyltransferase type 11 [Methanothrix harundinacea 6Ac]
MEKTEPINESRWNKTYFDEVFKKEDPWMYFSSDYEQKKYIRQLSLLVDRKPTPNRILEIGCAEAAQTRMIIQAFPEAEVVAVDISSNAIRRAKENLKSNNVTFLDADILECIANIDDKYFDIIIWSESLYYVGDRLSTRDIFELFEKITNKLNNAGILCMANIINQQNGPEYFITKEAIMNSYFSLLASLMENIHKSRFVEQKKSSGNYHEYQIWLFERNSGDDENGNGLKCRD